MPSANDAAELLLAKIPEFAELRFHLPALNDRDSKAGDMLDSFDFDQNPLSPLLRQERTCPLVPRLARKASAVLNALEGKHDQDSVRLYK
jgi:hypothetical protein